MTGGQRAGLPPARAPRRHGGAMGLLALLAVLVAGCAHPGLRPGAEARVPPFASQPYEPFSRGAAVAIALREWRLFGSPVDDAPPGPRAPDAPMPERAQGLWQRVGEYWWIGLNPDRPEGWWTGKHDANGQVFPRADDGQYAWSAAFISYVMRIAGAGDLFPYAPDHAHYINAAREDFGALRAWRPTDYAPRLGDLICAGRGRAAGIRFADLPAPIFPAHCAIVVARTPGQISVIGGNVGDAVSLTHVPVTADGKLAGPDGVVLDGRYPWFVVIQLLYPAP